MNSELSSPLTRFDIVMAALRMQLGMLLVMSGQSVISLLLVFFVWHAQIGSAEWLYGPLSNAVPLVLLLIFPQLLAANALGEARHAPVSSWPEMRPLIGRCVGLWLFVYSLGNIVSRVGTTIYDVATRSGSSILSSSTITVWLKLMPWIEELPVLLLGFFLAFGPVIRDHFRAR